MAQPITRVDDMSTGHDTYLPRPATKGSPDVFVNGKAVNREGDDWAPHGGIPGGPHSAETGHTTTGSSTVKANGLGVTRIGDPVEADTSGGGSPNVFAGG